MVKDNNNNNFAIFSALAKAFSAGALANPTNRYIVYVDTGQRCACFPPYGSTIDRRDRGTWSSTPRYLSDCLHPSPRPQLTVSLSNTL